MDIRRVQIIILVSFSAPAQHKLRRSAHPGEREDGEAQAAGGYGRLGAELHWKHTGCSDKNMR